MKPKIILVLGMHRSGTSALAGVLNQLGAAMPGELMPPAADNNQKGFFESKELYQFHEAVLAEAGSSWDDCLPIRDAYFTSPAGLRRREELAGILARDYAPHSLSAAKDPRMCRLLPLWLAATERAGIEALAVLPLRHPLEVAGSLESRNEFGTAKGLLLWLEHVLLAERATRSLPRIFVTYDDLLSDWETALRRIDAALGLDLDLTGGAARVAGFLAAELRHNVAHDGLEDRPDAPAGAAEAWLALNRLVEAPDDQSALSLLDSIGESYGQASRVFSPYLAWAQRKLVDIQDPKHLLQQARQHERDLAAARGRIAELERAARERDELKAELAALQADPLWRWTAPIRWVAQGFGAARGSRGRNSG